MTTEHTLTQSQIGMTVRVQADYDTTLVRVTDTLRAEGFGVLTEIDVKETLKKKLDVDFRPYKILGACNPPLAYSRADCGSRSRAAAALQCDRRLRRRERDRRLARRPTGHARSRPPSGA